MIKSSIQTKRKDWAKTNRLLESLTVDQLLKAAEQARRHQALYNGRHKVLQDIVEFQDSNARREVSE